MLLLPEETRARDLAQKQLPRILCLHGGGASAIIFRIQTYRLRRQLQQHFRFIFIDAPHESTPGPGVLPVFEGAGPFFEWASWQHTEDGRTAEARETAVVELLDRALAQQEDGEAPFVGIMGFSQGARVAAGLLLRKQNPAARDSHLRFGVLLAGTYPPICPPSPSTSHRNVIRVPTVHMHGSDDPHLAESKTLLAESCDLAVASLMEFKGGHHLPASPDDTKRLAEMILQAGQWDGLGFANL
jgi:predicted esterase